jgi:hypothetical protein
LIDVEHICVGQLPSLAMLSAMNGNSRSNSSSDAYSAAMSSGTLYVNPRYDPELEEQVQEQLRAGYEQQQWSVGLSEPLPVSFAGRDANSNNSDVSIKDVAQGGVFSVCLCRCKSIFLSLCLVRAIQRRQQGLLRKTALEAVMDAPQMGPVETGFRPSEGALFALRRQRTLFYLAVIFVSLGAKRRGQITYTAHFALSHQKELEEQWRLAARAKVQSRQKYGF